MAGHVTIIHNSKENISNNFFLQATNKPSVRDVTDLKSKQATTKASVRDVTDLKSKQDLRSTPPPGDFMQFFPWACKELGHDKYIYIKRSAEPIIKKPLSSKTKDKPNVSSTDMKTSSSSYAEMNVFRSAPDFVVIEATYLNDDELTALKFCDNRHISRLLFKLLGLIIRFYPKLSSITINRGLDQFIIYEISKFLSSSQITELILDNCPVSQGNYHILLDEPSKLTHLSLARCTIGDRVLSLICEKLVHPKPASKTLKILNLSTNSITDMGASDMAKCLRTNRRLRYINLSGNLLTDTGAETILSSLMEFQLTQEEYICSKHRYKEYLNAKDDFILRVVKEIQNSGEYEKEKRLKRSTLTVSQLQRKSRILENVNEPFPDKRTFYHRKALFMVPSLFGNFDDPFNQADTKSKDGGLFSNGNGVLCYLNLSYNNLGERTVKKLIRTLKHQQSLNREQKGLCVVRLDGNPIPQNSANTAQLEYLFEKVLSVVDMKLKYAKSRIPLAPGLAPTKARLIKK